MCDCVIKTPRESTGECTCT